MCCRLCNGSHSVVDCDKYKTLESKLQQVKNLKLCMNCLYKNHWVSECRNEFSCRHCGKRHHSVLCNKKNFKNPSFGENSKSKNKNNYSCSLPKKLPVPDETSNMTISSSMNSSKVRETSVLPTANVELISNGHIKLCKALFDCGSMKTFILSKIANIFNLRVVSRDLLELDGFNSVGKSKLYDLVEVKINTSEVIVTMFAYVVEELPHRITMSGRSNLVQKCTNIGFKLADTSVENFFH